MDYKALYDYRFENVNQEARSAVWAEISRFLVAEFGNQPASVLDPACGYGEFINSCGVKERWAIDLGQNGSSLEPSVKFTNSSFLDCQLPQGYFDLVFLSNILEHLSNQLEVNDFLQRVFHVLKPGGRIIVMGPNFKFTLKDYFDCADHCVALTNVSVAEHLAACHFAILKNFPKFLPYSFRSRLPANKYATKAYLRAPIFWRLMGKQFLLVAEKPRGLE